jgi:hypothetical protein
VKHYNLGIAVRFRGCVKISCQSGTKNKEVGLNKKD